MAEAHAKHHDYHLVDPSPWPLIGSISAFLMASGFVVWWKGMAIAGTHPGAFIFGAGIIGVLFTMFSWWSDVIAEANSGEFHTRVVQLHHRYGMMLFIASEVMFFVAWFWAYFDAALYPNDPMQYARVESARRRLAAQGHRDLRSLAPAAAQHPHPADLRHHGHLGAPRAARGRPQGREGRPVAHHHPGPRVQLRPGRSSTATPVSASRATSTAPPSSWRRASTART